MGKTGVSVLSVNRLFVAVAALAVAGVTACSTPAPESPEQVTQLEVIETVFENIDKRYAAATTIKTVSLAGLKRLSETDALLAVDDTGGSVELRYADRILGAWPEPTPNDHDNWAALTSRALTLARSESDKIQADEYGNLLKRFFSGGLAKLDRYTRYDGPDQARNTRARREGFGGLGVTIRYENGNTYVRKVHEGTPAFRAGLKAGDHITHIGRTALTGLSQRDVITKLRGPIHSRADLTISREASLTPVKITVIRAHIILPTIESKLENGILKIEISGFNQGTSRSLGKALSGAERGGDDVKGVILDLRGNPGGLLDQAVAVADFFLNDGRIISTRGRHRRANQIFDASWGERVHNLPIVVLINGRSASASEIVAAALRDRGRAVVVGASSYGKGSVQTIIRLPNRGELTLTWAHMIAPSGFNLQSHGVIPAICTSGPEDRLGPLMSAIKSATASGQRALVAMLRSRYAVRTDPIGARKLCPPSKLKRSEDIEIARYILTHENMYLQALHDGAPAIAER
tara:strand:- start:3063 stop:4625 length:1563 start_codon:yes stop_codon:yes gene_type:complete